MKIGLYFGTFNPIHVGHLIIANHMAQHPDLDQVWLVVSPQNPLKDKATLLADHHRRILVEVAVDDNPKLQVCDVEFHLPKPSYTVTTLVHLKERYPQHEFSLIMGEDNLRSLHKWFNYEHILDNYRVFVYPRILTEQEQNQALASEYLAIKEHQNVVFCYDVPVMKISSSFIRQAISEKRDVRYLLTAPVLKYIEEMAFYE